MIVGTIRNQVKLAVLDNKWQQKKDNLGKKQKKEMTAEQRQLQFLREQAEDLRESQKRAEIDAKIKSGATLSNDEIEYLRRNNPQALKDYEEIKQEKENYKKQLKSCRTKEEVERVKFQKMGSFLAEAKSITNNPYIPTGKKVALLGKILAKVENVADAHYEFTKTQAYHDLPTEEEKRESERERAELETGQTVEPGDEEDVSENEETEEVREALETETGDLDEEPSISKNTNTKVTKASPEIAKNTDAKDADLTFEQIKNTINDFLKKEHSKPRNVSISV